MIQKWLDYACRYCSDTLGRSNEFIRGFGSDSLRKGELVYHSTKEGQSKRETITNVLEMIFRESILSANNESYICAVQKCTRMNQVSSCDHKSGAELDLGLQWVSPYCEPSRTVCHVLIESMLYVVDFS